VQTSKAPFPGASSKVEGSLLPIPVHRKLMVGAQEALDRPTATPIRIPEQMRLFLLQRPP
jgi:hypothetical protein